MGELSHQQANGIAILHYEVLRLFLSDYLVQVVNNPQRAGARDKLTRLTTVQFIELSTDVYDEINRRVKHIPDLPFLSVNEAFHPKRNQARQKLATLPVQRFKDLASDVYFELERRFPMAVEAFENKHTPSRPTFASNPAFPPPSSALPRRPSAGHPKVPANVTIPSSGALPNSGTKMNLDDLISDLNGILSPSAENEKSYSNYPNSNQETRNVSSKAADAHAASNVGSAAHSVAASNASYPKGSQADMLQKMNDQMKREYEDKIERLQDLHQNAKQEYEERLAAADEKVKQASVDGMKYQSVSAKALTLEADLTNERGKYQELSDTYHKLDQAYSKLRQDHSELEIEYGKQRTMMDDIRKEASSLIEEIKILTTHLEETKAEADELRARNAALVASASAASVVSLASAASKPSAQPFNKTSPPLPLITASTGSNVSNSSISKSRTAGSSAGSPVREASKLDSSRFLKDDFENGIIPAGRLYAFQDAVEELLKSNSPTNVLMSMKKVVLSCKLITEDAENFENQRLDHSNKHASEVLQDCKEKLSDGLTSLMSVAKNFATHFDEIDEGDDSIAPAATVLSGSVISLVRSLKQIVSTQPNLQSVEARRNNAEKHGGDGEYPSYLESPYVAAPRNAEQRRESYDVAELKRYLESHTESIVEAIHTLLTAMRQTENYGDDFRVTITGITSIVSKLVDASRSTLAKPTAVAYRSRGNDIVDDLADANQKLEELGRSIMDSPNSKALKQRLASSAYEIAKVCGGSVLHGLHVVHFRLDWLTRENSRYAI